ncbi:ribonuclease H-like domain-containing protein [Tanacetum coccineum]
MQFHLPTLETSCPLNLILVLADEEEYVFSKSITSVLAVTTSKVKTSESKPKSVSKPLIEDWISDIGDENEIEFKSKLRKPSFAKVEFVKSNEHVKIPRESAEKVENNKQAKYPRKNSQSPRGNKRNWNNLMTQKLGSNFEFKNKACYVCGSFNHLIKDCDFYEKKMVEKPVWNNASRVNHQNSQRLTHPHPKGNFVPKAVLMKSGHKTLNIARQNSSKAAVSVNTARPINTAYLRPTVNSARTGNPQLELQEKGVIDSGCSRHMIGNKSYLSDYEEIDGGFVAFGGDPKGGKISTSKLDFEDVYFVKELKFNLFSVSQMCDKKNSVLFTDTECVVLSPDFQLLDENHVLLRVPIKDNMYSFDLKNIVLLGGLTCLFAKAILYESNLWHRRLGHTNFKTINKLVKGNLFSEKTPNIAGNGPNWLFDIDALTKSMNYEPVVVGNQSNGIAGTKSCENTGKASMETVPGKDYILLPFLTQDPPFSSSSKDSHDAGFKPSGEKEKKDVEYLENEDSEVPNTEEPRVNEEQDESVNSTNNINTASSTVNTGSIEDNVVDENTVYGCADDPNMPNLEEIVYLEDDEGVGAKADMNNLDKFMLVNPIPTTKIQKDHPFEQIIIYLHSAPQPEG